MADISNLDNIPLAEEAIRVSREHVKSIRTRLEHIDDMLDAALRAIARLQAEATARNKPKPH